MKKLSLIFTLVAIVAMSACNTEDVLSTINDINPREDYIRGEYYEELGGFVVDNSWNSRDLGTIIVMSKTDVGEQKWNLDDVESATNNYTYGDFNDWRLPDPTEVNLIMSIYGNAPLYRDISDFGLKRWDGFGDRCDTYYWYLKDGVGIWLRRAYKDGSTNPDENPHWLRVVREVKYE